MNTVILLFVLLFPPSWILSENSYFPIKTKPAEGITAFEAEWYGRSLQRMNEPALPDSAKEANAEIYRILILPTWGNSIAVRVDKHGQTYHLSARRLDGQAGYDPGELAETKDTDLSLEDSNTLGALLRDVDFFQMSIRDNVRGYDGDEWILEGVSQGQYHVVQRWCAASYDPNNRKLKPFLALTKFLLDKSKLSKRPSNKGDKLI